jgi:diguanylate cyclase (GGDEF)-like protein
MALRTRLSLAFVFVVLIPVAVGAVLVAVVAPHVLYDQQSGRLRTARTTVADALAARCHDASRTAQMLGLEVAALGPQSAVQRVLADSGANYAVVVNDAGAIVASAGSLPGAPTARPLPPALHSCATGANAGFATSASADLALADMPSLKAVAVAWSVGPATTSQLSRELDGHPGITLLAGGAVVSTTLPAATADRVAAAVHARPQQAGDVFDVGPRMLAVRSAEPGQPYVIVLSDNKPDTSGLTWVIVGVVLATILAALVIGRLLARLISRPVVELSDAAARVAGGDLDVAIPVRSRDEVGRLGTAFNDMTARLRVYIGELERSRDELRRNLDRLGATLAHTHDLAGILEVVLDSAITSVQAGGGAIMFTDAEQNLAVRVRRGRAVTDMPDDAKVPLGQGITGTVAATGEPVRGVIGEGPGLRPAPGEPTTGTVIAVPLKQSGHIAGVLNLYDKQDVREFSSHDLDTIRAFAGQARVAIENVLLHQEAQRLSLTDPLTGLWNYRYLRIGLGHEIERATRFGRPLAVLMLDLDRFKQVNDHYGHQVGDAVLMELGARMRAEVREVDILARYGGEEFVVVLPETDASGAAHTASRLGEVIRSTRFCADTDHPLDVTMSIGVAVFPDNGSTAGPLLRSADDALYAAKDAGRDCWRFAPTSGEPPGAYPAAVLDAHDEPGPITHSGPTR